MNQYLAWSRRLVNESVSQVISGCRLSSVAFHFHGSAGGEPIGLSYRGRDGIPLSRRYFSRPDCAVLSRRGRIRCKKPGVPPTSFTSAWPFDSRESDFTT